MTNYMLLGSLWDAQIWYSVPLIVAISLVYGATRHEYLKEIVIHALRAALWLIVFLGIIFAIVWWAGTRV
jgi:hypothetical protein